MCALVNLIHRIYAKCYAIFNIIVNTNILEIILLQKVHRDKPLNKRQCEFFGIAVGLSEIGKSIKLNGERFTILLKQYRARLIPSKCIVNIIIRRKICTTTLNHRLFFIILTKTVNAEIVQLIFCKICFIPVCFASCSFFYI